MKTKYLNTKNCKSLIPKIFDIRHYRSFDEYLEIVNSKEECKGIIDKLISRNQFTSNKKFYDRFLDCNFDVLFTLDFKSQQMEQRLDFYHAEEDHKQDMDHILQVRFNMFYPNKTLASFSIPLQALLKGWGDADEGYQGYVHRIVFNPYSKKDPDPLSKPVDMCYAGVTSRNWMKRFREHMHQSFSGGTNLFHRTWKNSIDRQDALVPEQMAYSSELKMLNCTKDEAMEWEEHFVDEYTLTPKGLNMIPGGYKGMKYLHKLRITDRDKISLEERDRAIAEYVRKNPRKGIPNPFVAALWEDDRFYLKVIGARDDTLSPSQVKQIRSLAEMGWAVPDIANEVDALNEAQVKNVISGRTYKRVH